MENKDYVRIVKIGGKFYAVYEEDAFIFHLLFKYKVFKDYCSFPEEALNRVKNKLDDNKINYQIIYPDESKNIYQDFKTLNKYIIFVKKAREYFSLSNRLEVLLKKIDDLDIYQMSKVVESLEKCLS